MAEEKTELRCRVCKKYKLLKDFKKDKRHRNGRDSLCTKCSIKVLNKWRAVRSPEKIEVDKQKAREYHKKWRIEHRVEIQRKAKSYRKNHLQQCRDWSYKHALKKYGLSLEDYYSIFSAQDNKCAICLKPYKDGDKRFHVDHNHKTGYNRGILCPFCNVRLLKYLMDNKTRAIGLVRYLQKAIDEDIKWV